MIIKGLGRENGYMTFICVVIFFENAYFLLEAFSTLGENDENGKFRITAEVIPLEYYLYLVLSLVFGVVSMWFIRYRDHQARWGARVFCSLLLPGFLLLYTLNMKIFSWNAFKDTVF